VIRGRASAALGVVGTAVLDRIHPWEPGPGPAGGRQRAEPVRSLGGIFYGLHALAALAPHPSRIVPAMRIGADAASLLRAHLAALGVDTRFLQPASAHQNAVELRYESPDRRREVLHGGVPPVRADRLGPFLREVDALHVNFVAGNELTLAGFRRVRAAFGGPIHVDLHSLLLGRSSTGLRFHRPLPGWRDWVACADVVQCNAQEAAMLWASDGRAARRDGASAAGDARVREGRPGAGRGSDGARPAAPRRARGAAPPPPPRLHLRALDRLARDVLAQGPRLFIVTDGGAAVRAWSGPRRPWLVRPRPPAPPVDPTGCGDVLGAAFCAFRFLHGLPSREALDEAVQAAAWNATRIGTADLAADLAAWRRARGRGTRHSRRRPGAGARATPRPRPPARRA
jgi:sugar/nucleoside kinase (ribokinase family)